MTGPGASLVRSDATAIPLGDNTVDLIVTSPPYYSLRSYQDGGEHYDGQIGSEATPTAFLDALWAVTAECWRVLKPTGSLFVNLGDKYAGTGGGNSNDGISGSSTLSGNGHKGGIGKAGPNKVKATKRTGPDRYNQASDGIRSKSLMGLPWRYAIGCIDPEYRAFEQWRALGRRADPDYPDAMVVPDEWAFRGILRSEIIWSKPNGLPESVTDRVRRSHEQWFHLTREGRYYSNVDEVREPHTSDTTDRRGEGGAPEVGMRRFAADGTRHTDGNPLGKLPGSVWTVPTQPLIVPDWLDVDHFAAFPTEWPRKLILGWSPPGICVECGEGRRATVDKTATQPPREEDVVRKRTTVSGGKPSAFGISYEVTGTECACDKPTAPTTPAVVLDPFGGTGTTAMVARALGRYGISCDLSGDYQRLAKWRIWQSGHAARVAAKTDGERQMDLFGAAS